MARGVCTFKKWDVKRAVEATRAAGLEVARIEIDKDGKIVVVTGKPPEQAGHDARGTEWDNL